MSYVSRQINARHVVAPSSHCL